MCTMLKNPLLRFSRYEAFESKLQMYVYFILFICCHFTLFLYQKDTFSWKRRQNVVHNPIVVVVVQS